MSAAQRRYNQRSAARKHRFVLEYLRDHPCLDCGEDDLVVLEFDHVRGEKLGNVSHLATNGASMARLEVEIAKCEVVCANCHRRRTARRGNHYRYLIGRNQ